MKKWVWYLIGGIVFLLAGGGVLYGVLTHKEPGLMKVCWKSGHAVYDNASCTQDLQWDRTVFPLTYFIDFDKDHKDYLESVEAGVKLWNREIGRDLFVRTEKREEAKLIVQWGSVEGNTGGYTKHFGTGHPERAEVTLVDATDVHAVYRFAAHELGHVLGLAHDEAPRSIMYPTQPGMTTDMTLVLPSDFDKKLLKELYQ